MNREDGVLDSVSKEGTEFRLHFFGRGGGIVRRIPWHKDPLTGEFFSGIEGPEVKASSFAIIVARHVEGDGKIFGPAIVMTERPPAWIDNPMREE